MYSYSIWHPTPTLIPTFGRHQLFCRLRGAGGCGGAGVLFRVFSHFCHTFLFSFWLTVPAPDARNSLRSLYNMCKRKHYACVRLATSLPYSPGDIAVHREGLAGRPARRDVSRVGPLDPANHFQGLPRRTHTDNMNLKARTPGQAYYRPCPRASYLRQHADQASIRTYRQRIRA